MFLDFLHSRTVQGSFMDVGRRPVDRRFVWEPFVLGPNEGYSIVTLSVEVQRTVCWDLPPYEYWSKGDRPDPDDRQSSDIRSGGSLSIFVRVAPN